MGLPKEFFRIPVEFLPPALLASSARFFSISYRLLFGLYQHQRTGKKKNHVSHFDRVFASSPSNLPIFASNRHKVENQLSQPQRHFPLTHKKILRANNIHALVNLASSAHLPSSILLALIFLALFLLRLLER